MRDTKGKLAALGEGELFRHLDRRTLERLATLATEVEIDAGTVLCEQGRVAQECWVVLSGQADVTVRGAQVATIGEGETIGEMGLLDHLPRSATVTARTAMSLLRVDSRGFHELIGDPHVSEALLEILSRRIRDLEHGRTLLS